eukprot:2768207-Amphidinium_carterae.1
MHEVSMAEVTAELEELEASSSPRFNKINTPDFGAEAFKAAMEGKPTPMHTQTANFPNSTGHRNDCGQ